MTEAERKLCDFKYNRSGGFYMALWEAIFRADGNNLAKLSKGFPEEVQAYMNFSRVDGWWDKLEAEYTRGKEEEIERAR
jgi:hypothetical protein